MKPQYSERAKAALKPKFPRLALLRLKRKQQDSRAKQQLRGVS